MYLLVVFKNGKPVELLGTFQDITNEQNLINELQYNVEKFSSIFLVLMPFLSLILQMDKSVTVI
jgi:hypothetical protein